MPKRFSHEFWTRKAYYKAAALPIADDRKPALRRFGHGEIQERLEISKVATQKWIIFPAPKHLTLNEMDYDNVAGISQIGLTCKSLCCSCLTLREGGGGG